MIKRMVTINGAPRMAITRPDTTLATYLRESLGLTSVKVGCGQGHCGSCNVIVDGKLVRSCSYKMSRLTEGATITTLEGIGTPDNLHPLRCRRRRWRWRPRTGTPSHRRGWDGPTRRPCWTGR